MPPASTPPVAFRLRRPYSNDDEFLVGDGHAIFRSGMVLIGAGPRPAGLIVRFELALRDGATLFRGEGKVVVHRAEPEGGKPQGLEIRFTRLDARGKALVDRLIRSREPSLGESDAPPESVSFEVFSGPPSIIPPLHVPPDLIAPASTAHTFELATPLTPPSTSAPSQTGASLEPSAPLPLATSHAFELATPLTPPLALGPLEPLEPLENLAVALPPAEAIAAGRTPSISPPDATPDGTISPFDPGVSEPSLALEGADATVIAAAVEAVPEETTGAGETRTDAPDRAVDPSAPEPELAQESAAPPPPVVAVVTAATGTDGAAAGEAREGLARLRQRTLQEIHMEAAEREAHLQRLRARSAPGRG
jgi:hypothetical protein